jgi:hypothetical protein
LAARLPLTGSDQRSRYANGTESSSGRCDAPMAVAALSLRDDKQLRAV